MMGFNVEEATRNNECLLEKHISSLRKPAHQTKAAIVDKLKKSEQRFIDEIKICQEDERKKTALMKKLVKISNELNILENLDEDDIVKFALTTTQRVMTVASNPRMPLMLRMKARVASHKPLSSHLARIKLKLEEAKNLEDEEPDSGASKPLDKMCVNNQIVKMRKNMKQAKVHIIHKLTKQIKKLRSSNGKNKEKNENRADRLVKKIQYIKEMSEDEISRFALTSTQDLTKLSTDINSSLKTQMMATIAIHKCVSPTIAEFRNKFPEWNKNVPKILMKKKSKKKKQTLSSEIKENSKENNISLIKRLKLPRKTSVSEELGSGKYDSSKEESSESEEDSENDELSNGGSIRHEGDSRESSESEEDSKNDKLSRGGSIRHEGDSRESSESEEDSENDKLSRGGSIQHEGDSRESSESEEGSENDKLSNGGSIRHEGDSRESSESEVERTQNTSSDENDFNDNICSNVNKKYNSNQNLKTIKNNIKKSNKTMSKNHPNLIEQLNKDNDSKVNIKNNSRKSSKNGEEIIQKIPPKVVDPFFMTSTNEEYVTSQVPSADEENCSRWRTRSNFFESRESNTFHKLDRKWNSKDNYLKRNKFRQFNTHPYKNPAFRVPDKGSENNLPRFTNNLIIGNRKERRKALHKPLQEEKSEKLHPSWEAKKKLSSIASFQGTKIKFD